MKQMKKLRNELPYKSRSFSIEREGLLYFLEAVLLAESAQNLLKNGLGTLGL